MRNYSQRSKEVIDKTSESMANIIALAVEEGRKDGYLEAFNDIQIINGVELYPCGRIVDPVNKTRDTNSSGEFKTDIESGLANKPFAILIDRLSVTEVQDYFNHGEIPERRYKIKQTT